MHIFIMNIYKYIGKIYYTHILFYFINVIIYVNELIHYLHHHRHRHIISIIIAIIFHEIKNKNSSITKQVSYSSLF